MIQHDERTHRAVLALHSNEDFRVFMSWVIESYMDDIVKTTHVPTEHRDYYAGKSVALEDLIDQVGVMSGNGELKRSRMRDKITSIAYA